MSKPNPIPPKKIDTSDSEPQKGFSVTPLLPPFANIYDHESSLLTEEDEKKYADSLIPPPPKIEAPTNPYSRKKKTVFAAIILSVLALILVGILLFPVVQQAIFVDKTPQTEDTTTVKTPQKTVEEDIDVHYNEPKTTPPPATEIEEPIEDETIIGTPDIDEPNLTDILPAISDSDSIPLSETETSEQLLESVGASGINIIWTRHSINCGYVQAKNQNSEQDDSLWVNGCYQSKTPNTIYVYWGAQTDYETRKFVLLHEYGHYLQSTKYPEAADRLRATNNTQTLEDDATCWAIHLGATPVLECSIEGWEENWLARQ